MMSSASIWFAADARTAESLKPAQIESPVDNVAEAEMIANHKDRKESWSDIGKWPSPSFYA